jgi:hypothetical protein
VIHCVQAESRVNLEPGAPVRYVAETRGPASAPPVFRQKDLPVAAALEDDRGVGPWLELFVQEAVFLPEPEFSPPKTYEWPAARWEGRWRNGLLQPGAHFPVAVLGGSPGRMFATDAC